jgi:hypothetical protein
MLGRAAVRPNPHFYLRQAHVTLLMQASPPLVSAVSFP